ncbi:MAG: hypothetical protein OEU26_08315, partial [Candidatus Tectomicrobia bacterium]|nr:hypothetical protein [Candidatus Tectomicrobia bacterium]
AARAAPGYFGSHAPFVLSLGSLKGWLAILALDLHPWVMHPIKPLEQLGKPPTLFIAWNYLRHDGGDRYTKNALKTP